ncbi:MAG: hypothetical protein Tsb0020_13960 [Haliangiales bacterium]
MKTFRLPKGPWHRAHKSRLSHPSARSYSLTQRFWLWLVRQKSNSERDLNVFSALVKLGPIFPRYLLFLSHILPKGQIARADKERIILRVAYRMGCIYEWGHHSHFADQLGISAADVCALAEPVFVSGDERLSAFVAGVDELIDERAVGDETWSRLAAVLTEAQLVEFCMLVGHYIMIAGFINSVGVTLEPGYLEGIGE